MRFSKLTLMLSVVILLLIFFYSWFINRQILQSRYSSILSSQPAFSYFKINAKPKSMKYEIRKTEVLADSYQDCSSSTCIVLAAACCGERANETYTMMKSAVMLTKSNFVIEIFTEKELMSFFKTEISKWPEKVRNRVKLNLHIASYPSHIDDKTWRNLFRECASIRLFLPSLLKEVDSLIYVDTDVLFLAPLEELWHHFSRMNASQMVALAPEHEDPATGWYNRFAKHPYYGKLGVNSGVMLMNLTRLRSFGWEDYLVPIEKEFHSKLSWGDQDIINIIFHYHPDKLYLMGCEYNYRPDHCMYMNICKAVNDKGIFALHGSRKVFHTEKQPAFKAIYQTWNKFELKDNLRQDFYYPVTKYFIKNGTQSNCGKLRSQFMKNIEKLIAL